MYALGLQVELSHQLGDVETEVGFILLHLCVHQVAVAFGHTYLPLAPPPIQYGQRNTEADVLLFHGVAPGILPSVGGLCQPEAQVEVRLQTGVGTCLGHGTLALQPATLHVLHFRAILGCQQQGFIQVNAKVGHLSFDAHPQLHILADAQV